MYDKTIKTLAKIIVFFKKRKMARKVKKENKNKTFKQYTKRFVTALTMIACLWVTWSYILATYSVIKLGNYDVLQELSKEVILSIISVSLGYMTKAFIETYCEKKLESIELQNTIDTEEDI